MKQFILVLFLFSFLCGCSTEKVPEYKNLMESHEYIILDVRTKEEYLESHILGAKNISYDEIDETIDLDKDKYIFVYCRSGSRSSIAYEKLVNLGYTVYDLGGISSIDLPKE